MCGMSSVWLQGEGRDSASEEVPPPWVSPAEPWAEADRCRFAVGSARPAPKRGFPHAPEQERAVSGAQQWGLTEKALFLRVCLSVRLVAEKVFQSFCFSGRLAWWIKSCFCRWKQIAVRPSILPCMLLAWVTCMCDVCAYKYIHIHLCICKKRKKLLFIFFQKPCGQKKSIMFKRRYAKRWGGWEQVTSCPG